MALSSCLVDHRRRKKKFLQFPVPKGDGWCMKGDGEGAKSTRCPRSQTGPRRANTEKLVSMFENLLTLGEQCGTKPTWRLVRWHLGWTATRCRLENLTTVSNYSTPFYNPYQIRKYRCNVSYMFRILPEYDLRGCKF